jgi:hypothetical protein
MSDTPEPPIAATTPGRLDELVAELRAAHAPDATQEVRYRAAVNITRALLGTQAPEKLRNAAPPPSPSLDPLLKAITSIPREQVLQFLMTGVRSFLTSSPSPTYLSRPTPPTGQTPAPSPVPSAQPIRRKTS